jgi:small subunit ribosomal protein S21
VYPFSLFVLDRTLKSWKLPPVDTSAERRVIKLVRLKEPVAWMPLEVTVDGDNVERAIKALKRKMANEGIYKEIKKRKFYMKPSEERKRKQREAERRRRKALRARRK